MAPTSCPRAATFLSARRPRKACVRSVVAQASFGEMVRDFFERTRYENWAPRSARAWRLRGGGEEVWSQSRGVSTHAPSFSRTQSDRSTGLLVANGDIVARHFGSLWAHSLRSEADRQVRHQGARELGCDGLPDLQLSQKISSPCLWPCTDADGLEKRMQALAEDSRRLKEAQSPSIKAISLENLPSFEETSDSDLAEALNDRLQLKYDQDNSVEEAEEKALTGALVLCTIGIPRPQAVENACPDLHGHGALR
jgi:hypothetical protein